MPLSLFPYHAGVNGRTRSLRLWLSLLGMLALLGGLSVWGSVQQSRAAQQQIQQSGETPRQGDAER
ncbi:hypothetical protein SU48_03230 [Deinococcus puniceus]|uniref:Uncharacterized protein n=1 Tax=Deinococcus puniceus TaxID=1182568 RepID=A0A172T7Z2_9DEIO|nr:hypothetical protein SU48_03230 [Deinococcus puniceus]